MTEHDIANTLTTHLLNMGFIVCQYNSYTTNSIYLKLDYGVSCGIRISDHQGKKKYHYKFNVMRNYQGKDVIYNNDLPSYFFSFDELDKVLELVKKEKEDKILKYGIQNYKEYMEKESKSELYKRFRKLKGEN